MSTCQQCGTTASAGVRFCPSCGAVSYTHLDVYKRQIRGRALSERLQEYGFRLGLSLVICLMVFATYNDVARFGPVMLNWITSLWI